MDDIKMIVVDLDGTLLNSDKKVSLYTKEVLLKARNQGIYIVLASGRTIDSAMFSTEGAPYATYIISNNGGAIYDIVEEQVLYNTKIDTDEGIEIFDTYKEQCKEINMCSKWYYYQYCSNEKNFLSKCF